MPHIRLDKFLRLSCVLFVTSALVPTYLSAQPRGLTTPSPLKVASLRPGADGLLTIENDQISVGINSKAGGAITYLAFKDNKGGNVDTRNMVSNPDLGRQIQIGVYGGPYDYANTGNPAWTGLGWNPIQAGDVYGNPSEVLEIRKETNLLYAKTIPKHFAFNNRPGDMTIEHWLRLEGNVVKVHAKLVMLRSDKNQYEARQQELPCVYLTGEYHNMWLYRDKDPFTNGSLALERIQPPNTFLFGDVFPTEPWMASTNDKGYGVGLYLAGNNYEWKRGYFGSDLGGDEFSTVASYIAATPKVLLDHNMTYEWDYELIMGHLNEIRSYVYTKPKLTSGPNYRFDSSRKGWHYHDAEDTGWPVSGKLHIKLDVKPKGEILSPFVFWKGRSIPKIYVRAAFKTKTEKFILNWRLYNDNTTYPSGDRLVTFPVINDGEFHTYEIDLSKNDNWLNASIGQLQLRADASSSSPGDWVELGWIATSADGPKDEVVTPPIVDPPVVVIPPTEPPVVTPPTEPPVVTPPTEPPVVTPPTEPPVVIKPTDPPIVAVPCVEGCTQVTVQKIRYTRSNRKR